MHSSGRMSFSWVLYHILSPLAFYVGPVFFIMILYRSGDSTGLRKWSSSALMNQSCSSTSCDPQCSSTQQWKALNPLKWQCLITKWGNLLKDQQTHWTKMSIQEGAIKPASGQPCSCQANLCEGVHPLWYMCTTCGFAPKCLRVAAKNLGKKRSEANSAYNVIIMSILIPVKVELNGVMLRIRCVTSHLW